MERSKLTLLYISLPINCHQLLGSDVRQGLGPDKKLQWLVPNHSLPV